LMSYGKRSEDSSTRLRKANAKTTSLRADMYVLNLKTL
jgi:hypothetical protein